MSERDRVIMPIKPDTALGPERFPSETTAPATQPVSDSYIVAQAVRSIYISCYRHSTGKLDYGNGSLPQWDGNGEEDQWGRRGRINYWERLARVILENDADPYDYIQAQFMEARRKGAPAPNMICNQAAIDRWRQFQSGSVEQLRLRLDSDQNILSVKSFPMIKVLGWEPPRAVRYCVTAVNTVKLSPLFRYATAVIYGFDDLADYFRESALTQYVFQQSAYDEVWGELIPQDLREAAAEVRGRWKTR